MGVALVHQPLAPAAESDKAENLIRQGLDLRRTGDDQKAYHLFREAYDLTHSSRSAAQLGFCEQALGRWAEAETHMSESLRATGDPWVKKNRTAIEHALGLVKTKIGRVEVSGGPPGAEVVVNGNVVGQLPLGDPVRVGAGEVEIELRAPGFARVAKTLRVEGGQYQKLTLRAEKETPAPPPESHASGPASVGGTPAGAAGSPETPAGGASQAAFSLTPETPPGPEHSDAGPTPAPAAWRGTLKYVSWGLALAAAGVGVYGFAHNWSLVSTFDSGCGIDSRGNPRAAQDPPQPGFSDMKCADLKRQYESASILGVVGMAAAVGLAGAGVVLWLTEPGAAEHQAAAWSCAPAVTNRGTPFAGCALRF